MGLKALQKHAAVQQAESSTGRRSAQCTDPGGSHFQGSSSHQRQLNVQQHTTRVHDRLGSNRDARDTLDTHRRGRFEEMEVVAPHRQNPRQVATMIMMKTEDRAPTLMPWAFRPFCQTEILRSPTVPSSCQFQLV